MHVQHANTAPILQQYGCIRLNLTMEVYLNINWQAIARARAKHPIQKVVRISKMIYGWMPVGHNKVKCNLASSRCPCCNAQDETFLHLFQCPIFL